jgi:hypothetical protein
MHYAISRKVASSRPDETNECFQFTSFPATLGHGVYPASKRNGYQCRCRADNFTAICEPNVYIMGMLNISQPYRPHSLLRGWLYFFLLVISTENEKSTRRHNKFVVA